MCSEHFFTHRNPADCAVLQRKRNLIEKLFFYQ
ncbi:Uncharacterised protein [Mycobacterium tuberculosis]|nr:Uncharacterised protein [Mycobacterium tuberculosis]